MFEPIPYQALNSRQKENYNFQKVAGRLADFGFNCIRLSDDWHGADFIACHIDGQTFLKVQLKARFILDKKYLGKGVHIAFLNLPDLYLYPHDQIYEAFSASPYLGSKGKTEGWEEAGARSWSSLPRWAEVMLINYKVPDVTAA